MIVRKCLKDTKWEIFLTCETVNDCEFVYNFAKELTRLQTHYLFTQEIIYSCEGASFCFRIKNPPMDKELLREIEILLQEVGDAGKNNRL